VPSHVEVIRCSGQILVPTTKGQLFKSQIANDKARLEHQCEIHTVQINGIPPSSSADDDAPAAPIIDEPTRMPDPPAPTNINPDTITVDNG
jgi:hypothetical protein